MGSGLSVEVCLARSLFISCAFLRSRLARLRFAFARETTVLQGKTIRGQSTAASMYTVDMTGSNSHDNKAEDDGGKTDAGDRDQRYSIEIPTIALDPPAAWQSVRD